MDDILYGRAFCPGGQIVVTLVPWKHFPHRPWRERWQEEEEGEEDAARPVVSRHGPMLARARKARLPTAAARTTG